ncbi:MAG: hypothetical protein CFH26_00143, partial [Alphaproteobacteria bacterium MarineAlpha6_Bin4]
MNKFKLSHFFLFLFFSFINIDFINAGYGSKEIGTEKEKKGFKEIDLNNDGKIDYYEF